MFKSFLRSPCVQLCYLSCSYSGLEPGLSSLEKKIKEKKMGVFGDFYCSCIYPVHIGWLDLFKVVQQTGILASL